MSTNNNDNFDDGSDVDNNNGDYWWWSPEAYAIKFVIVASIFGVCAIYLLGGYMHAQRRMKRGLPPLAYHRWMVSRAQRAHFDPNYEQRQFTFYQHQDGYAMQGYAPPPPAYNPHAPPPPSYQPPEGGSKILPSQEIYDAPSEPPPSSSNTHLPAREPAQQSTSGGFLSRFKRH